MKDNALDKLVKSLLEEEIENQKIPQGAKERISASLGLNKRKNKVPNVKYIVAGILVLLLATSFLFSTPAKSIDIDIVKKIHYFLHNKIYNISKTIGEEVLETPEKQAPEINKEEEVTLDEAKTRVTFSLKTPTYLPEGLELQKVGLIEEEKKSTIILKYGQQSQFLLIKIMGIIEKGATGTIYDQDDTKIEKILINNQEGSLIINKSALITLEWHEQGILYILQSNYPKEEIVKIAKNLK